MSEVDEAISYVFVWHALSDACPKCQSLNGQEFRDQDLFKSVVWSPFWGDIWHLDEGYSLAHPNCRCQLEVRVNVVPRDIQIEFQKLMETLRLLRAELERGT